MAVARDLPNAAQDDIARVILLLAGADDDSGSVTLSPDDRAAIAEPKAAASRGAFATNEQVRAIRAKHGP